MHVPCAYTIHKSMILQEANGWCEEGAYDLLRKTLGEMIRKTAERSKCNYSFISLGVLYNRGPRLESSMCCVS